MEANFLKSLFDTRVLESELEFAMKQVCNSPNHYDLLESH